MALSRKTRKKSPTKLKTNDFCRIANIVSPIELSSKRWELVLF